MGLDPVVAEKVGGAAQCDDEPVIVKIANTGVNDLFIGVNTLYFGDMDIYIFCMLKYFSERKGDTGRLEPGRGDLVHERLKLVIIVTIDEEYFIIRIVERAGDAQACKTCANDDNSFLIADTLCHTMGIILPTDDKVTGNQSIRFIIIP
jgi:hypothetical protein